MEIGGISLNLFPQVAGGFAFLPYAATLCGTQRTENRRLEIAFRLLPLDRGRRLRGHVEDDPVHLGHGVRDPRRDTGEHLVGQARPVGRHRILGGHRAQHDRVPVGAPIPLNTDGAHIRQQHNRTLPNLAAQSRGAQLLADDEISGAQNVQTLLRHLTDDPNTQARPREGLTIHKVVGQAELTPNGPD